jgi:sulfide:quinone oxidoreductase
MSISRRDFLKTLTAGAALHYAPLGVAAKPSVRTNARIVILGAGAAGTALANRFADGMEGGSITVIDGRKEHLYQPGFTLIGAGLKTPDYSVSQTADWLPNAATLISEWVVEIDPVIQAVSTTGGKKIPYDVLIVAMGARLAYEKIEGMSKDLIGKHGIGSVYAGAEYAEKTWKLLDQFTDTGGRGVFTRPATEMKCAGQPLKYTFIAEDYATRKNTRDRTEIEYFAHDETLFGVPIVHEKLRMLFTERNIKTSYNHVMTAIDPGRQVATFKTPNGLVEQEFDFTHVIPPMEAPGPIKDSDLAWKTGAWGEQGWVEADPSTLRHPRYSNVFSVGDIAGVPKGKTAASVKWQVPVVVDHVFADLEGRESTERFNGYTSCPLITKIGRAMLVEFDYNNDLTPSFPGIISPLEELWISWLMKEVALKATYNAMLRGRA